MQEEVIRICKQLQQEAQTVIEYMQNAAAIAKTGSAQSIENTQMFNDLAIDNVDHCQKLVLALSSCFYQTPKKKEGVE